MTNIEKIRENACRSCQCHNCSDVRTLCGYIDILEKALEKERKNVKAMELRVANFEQLKENFRMYREKHGSQRPES